MPQVYLQHVFSLLQHACYPHLPHFQHLAIVIKINQKKNVDHEN